MNNIHSAILALILSIFLIHAADPPSLKALESVVQLLPKLSTARSSHFLDETSTNTPNISEPVSDERRRVYNSLGDFVEPPEPQGDSDVSVSNQYSSSQSEIDDYVEPPRNTHTSLEEISTPPKLPTQYGAPEQSGIEESGTSGTLNSENVKEKEHDLARTLLTLYEDQLFADPKTLPNTPIRISKEDYVENFKIISKEDLDTLISGPEKFQDNEQYQSGNDLGGLDQYGPTPIKSIQDKDSESLQTSQTTWRVSVQNENTNNNLITNRNGFRTTNRNGGGTVRSSGNSNRLRTGNGGGYGTLGGSLAPPSDTYGAPNDDKGPSDSYGAPPSSSPSDSYGAPPQDFNGGRPYPSSKEEPSDSYGAPPSSPPSDSYGAPPPDSIGGGPYPASKGNNNGKSPPKRPTNGLSSSYDAPLNGENKKPSDSYGAPNPIPDFPTDSYGAPPPEANNGGPYPASNGNGNGNNNGGYSSGNGAPTDAYKAPLPPKRQKNGLSSSYDAPLNGGNNNPSDSYGAPDLIPDFPTDSYGAPPPEANTGGPYPASNGNGNGKNNEGYSSGNGAPIDSYGAPLPMENGNGGYPSPNDNGGKGDYPASNGNGGYPALNGNGGYSNGNGNNGFPSMNGNGNKLPDTYGVPPSTGNNGNGPFTDNYGAPVPVDEYGAPNGSLEPNDDYGAPQSDNGNYDAPMDTYGAPPPTNLNRFRNFNGARNRISQNFLQPQIRRTKSVQDAETITYPPETAAIIDTEIKTDVASGGYNPSTNFRAPTFRFRNLDSFDSFSSFGPIFHNSGPSLNTNFGLRTSSFDLRNQNPVTQGKESAKDIDIVSSVDASSYPNGKSQLQSDRQNGYQTVKSLNIFDDPANKEIRESKESWNDSKEVRYEGVESPPGIDGIPLDAPPDIKVHNDSYGNVKENRKLKGRIPPNKIRQNGNENNNKDATQNSNIRDSKAKNATSERKRRPYLRKTNKIRVPSSKNQTLMVKMENMKKSTRSITLNEIQDAIDITLSRRDDTSVETNDQEHIGEIMPPDYKIDSTDNSGQIFLPSDISAENLNQNFHIRKSYEFEGGFRSFPQQNFVRIPMAFPIDRFYPEAAPNSEVYDSSEVLGYSRGRPHPLGQTAILRYPRRLRGIGGPSVPYDSPRNGPPGIIQNPSNQGSFLNSRDPYFDPSARYQTGGWQGSSSRRPRVIFPSDLALRDPVSSGTEQEGPDWLAGDNNLQDIQEPDNRDREVLLYRCYQKHRMKNPVMCYSLYRPIYLPPFYSSNSKQQTDQDFCSGPNTNQSNSNKKQRYSRCCGI